MPNPPLLAQFGAGSIGRSLVGQLFSLAGWEVVFLDVVDTVIDGLNARHGYRVTLRDDLVPGQPEHIDVTRVSGIHLRDRERVTDLLARADLAGTSVGAANLEAVCGFIAEALPRRCGRPLSVMLCENLHGAARLAEGFLAKALPPGFPLRERVGLVEAAISKMVPPIPQAVRKEDPLTLRAEAYNTLYLDRDAYLGTPPVVSGVAWRGRFAAYVDRKLLIHNFGHAAAAYHACLAGKTFIWEGMNDAAVWAETAGCMMEAARGLAIRHPDVFTFDENRAWVDDLLRRFRNQALADPVFRVGRDLKRKLAPGDRCIGVLRLMAETGVDAPHSSRAVAAAFLFSARDENGAFLPGDLEVTELAMRKGPEAALTGVCGLDPERDAGIIRRVAEEYRKLRSGMGTA